MSKINRSKEDLENQIREQINFMINSCKLYDEGNHSESKRMALTLRILFHEPQKSSGRKLFNSTLKSISLLGQLNLRDISWIDTADPYDPKNLVSHFGLFSIHFDGPSKRLPWLIPKGTPTGILKKSNFNDWWINKVVATAKGNGHKVFSRKDLILNVANTDGGAHVDIKLDESFANLSRGNALGFTVLYRGIKYPLLNPELPCLRQIAHEVLLTLQEKYTEYFIEKYNSHITIKPYGKIFEEGFKDESFIFEMFIKNSIPS